MDLFIMFEAASIVLLIFVSGFFSGSETALTAASRSNMHQLLKKGNPNAKKAFQLIENYEVLIGSILFCNNLANILATSIATSLFIYLLGEGGVAVATVIMTLVLVVFAEVLPKTYAINNPDKSSLAVAAPMSVIVNFVSPAMKLLMKLIVYFIQVCGLGKSGEAIRILSPYDQIKGTVELLHSQGAVYKSDRDMLDGLLDLNNLNVGDVMVHRVNMFMINVDDDLDSCIQEILSSPYTRIPLWKNNEDNIIGMLHVKDLAKEVYKQSSDKKIDLKSVALDVWFVPETATLKTQLREFLANKSKMAIVVDEYGSVQGMVSLEDILEEIVGQIVDEHDEKDFLTFDHTGAVVVEGVMSIRDLNRRFNWDLPESDATTIAGLVIHEARLIPEIGQKFTFHGFMIEIIDKDRNRLKTVKIKSLS